MLNEKRCVLIVDDEVKMVRVLKDLLKSKNFMVLEAFDGEQAIDVYFEHSSHIDLVLLDVMMPKADGFEVLEYLRSNSSLTPVIMLTAKGEEYDQLKGFNAGADDYITKPFSPTLLLARIETLLKRLGKDSETEFNKLGFNLNSSKRTLSIDGTELTLTKREFDLIYFFIINETIVFSREQILNSVWGYDFEGDVRTVDTHIKQLRNKLGEKASCIKTVHGIGYRFEVA